MKINTQVISTKDLGRQLPNTRNTKQHEKRTYTETQIKCQSERKTEKIVCVTEGFKYMPTYLEEKKNVRYNFQNNKPENCTIACYF